MLVTAVIKALFRKQLKEPSQPLSPVLYFFDVGVIFTAQQLQKQFKGHLKPSKSLSIMEIQKKNRRTYVMLSYNEQLNQFSGLKDHNLQTKKTLLQFMFRINQIFKARLFFRIFFSCFIFKMFILKRISIKWMLKRLNQFCFCLNNLAMLFSFKKSNSTVIVCLFVRLQIRLHTSQLT